MGKNLKGKELGKGIGQRKDGLYYARCTDAMGQRQEKCFQNLRDAKNWQKERQFWNAMSQRQSESADAVKEMTVDEWFQFWQDVLLKGLSPNTVRNYRERYERNAKPIIGRMRLSDVKPMHCKAVFNSMDGVYADSTIRQAYIALGTMFKAAKENGLIDRHPMEGVRLTGVMKAPDEIRFLTVEEQASFIRTAEHSHNYAQYALVLETGLRTGELIALTWDAIDWKARTLTVNKTMEFRYQQKAWRAGPPKTRHGYRTIPLTDRAYGIFRQLYQMRTERKEDPELDQTLTYVDLKTARQAKLYMRNLVFVNWRTGKPTKNSSYNTHLYKLCDEAGIPHFSMHALRHAYATRAIERGVPPKVLQKLLGHASVKTTMDRYVHVTDDSLALAVQQFQGGQSA